MKIFASLILALLLAALAGPVGADVKNNWHVHDGVSAPIAFFPTILTGGDVDAYLEDPAHCTNATDKSLLGPVGVTAEQPPFVGMCQTSDQVIHLKVGAAAPAGWDSVLFNGITWYYKITDR